MVTAVERPTPSRPPGTRRPGLVVGVAAAALLVAASVLARAYR